MTDRDRLAADLYHLLWDSEDADRDFDQPEEWWMSPNEFADRLIALGWRNPAFDPYRLDEERLARALPGWMTEYPKGCTEEELARDLAAAIAKAYREDEG